jgi:hypothetical protein
MPVVVATGDVTLFRKPPQPEHFRFSRAMETLYLWVLCNSGRTTAAHFAGCSTADWRAIGCHETNIPQASHRRL